MVDKAKDTYDTLKEAGENVESWPMSEYDKKRTATDALMARFKDDFKGLLDFHGTLTFIRDQHRGKQQVEKRSLRSKLKGFCQQLIVDGGLPEGLARLLVEVVGGADRVKDVTQMGTWGELDLALKWFQAAEKVGDEEQIREVALMDPDMEPIWEQIRK